MSLSLSIVWICITALFAVFASYFARRSARPDVLFAFYAVLVVFSNFAASKTIAFDFGFFEVFGPAGVLTFALTFLITDIVNEKYGRQETQKMIATALFIQFAVVIFSFIVVRAKPAPFFLNQEGFVAVFGAVPRIVIASLTAFFISENMDAYLFQWFRKITGGKHLWMRNAFSSLPSMFIDSVIFIIIAFSGIMPVVPLIIGLSLTKWLVGIIDIPFMYLARYVMTEKPK